MAYAERVEGDGDFVPNPAQVKEMHTTDPEQAYELLKAAATLGMGVALSNYVEPGASEEWWRVDIFEDPPLRKGEDGDAE
ncbi:hypothetical protein [Streptomyces sp. CC224B]|uniref:hypothetical protein n=1 Tax=Streptomyces sp. CC224B TaxID=3044571 RepID=UPI0024A829E6|nr:hypothetical protein [Streptomyces sp. CC224B]